MSLKHKIRPDLEKIIVEITTATEDIKNKIPSAKTNKQKYIMQGIVFANKTTLGFLASLLKKLELMEGAAEQEMLRKTGGIYPAAQGPLIQVVGGFRDKK